MRELRFLGCLRIEQPLQRKKRCATPQIGAASHIPGVCGRLERKPMIG
jgi:hypothetical protein